jgi:serine phosphatase RsbU (regulator of sigma subunit)/putative methionine-R-sulfoxide reductase with GAF domain
MPWKPARNDVQPLPETGRVNRLYAVLSRVNEAMVRIREPQELYEEACRIVVDDGQFVFAWIGFVEPESQFIQFAAQYGQDGDYLDIVKLSLSVDVPEGRGPTGTALREGRPFINNDTERNPVMAPWRDEQLKRGFRSSASFPLKAEGETIGALTMYADTPDRFDAEEIRLLASLADDFSFALESAQVSRQRASALAELSHSNEELERRVAERTASLQELLDERVAQAGLDESLNRINASLHSTLDFDEIMCRVVVEITDALDVDATVVQVHEHGIWRFAFEHGLPAHMRDLQFPDSEVPLSMRVLTTRQPVVVNDVPHDTTVNRPLMESFRISAIMAVPMIMRDEVFGVLIADRFEDARPFTDRQLDFLQKAAATLSLALENARLYGNERAIAERLQSALISLPASLESVEFAHAYHSATEGTRVGGDFYDLFDIDADTIGITIGDVAGKGLDAAVLTSLIRNTIRAHAMQTSKSPREVVSLTNEIVHKATPPEAFATVFFATLDRRDGTLTYSSAGHTTAAVLSASGIVTQWEWNGPIVGAFEGVEFGQSQTRLAPNDLLFLYTDGLTEARREGELYGEARLFEFLGQAGGSAEDVVGDVVSEVVSYSRGVLRDDLAILAIRRAR